ncbi:TOBE domain-containing protein [Methylocystis parvus]|uniref:LysR family transcriptional regulator n=1 Tax=Methylocystis parvus TaxID=134 RepID=A0A6B8MB21_9HYPH|nr:TOBE domain-containing protein [Methylocystis parvus]QGM98473.1 LysR family transcriptional regulator [Methylocystis parvus]WBK01189.1 TOBE domain-containing protein [Methylocystis parvus OBBP]
MSPTRKIDALLALRSEGKLLIGRDRIKVLEAVAEHKSISKAAKAVGFSYKAAWDAVTAINNLLPSPAFVTKAGGKSGGGAEVTAEGLKLIETFHKLEDRLSRISSMIAAEGLDGQDDFPLWSLGLRISARNLFRAEVVSVKKWPVDVEVTLQISGEHKIYSVITNDGAEDLDLRPGRKVVALVKSSFVELASSGQSSDDSRNLFTGVVSRRTDAERNCELLIDIGAGKTMTAVLPRRDVESMGLDEGSQVTARFAPEDVILAAD